MHRSQILTKDSNTIKITVVCDLCRPVILVRVMEKRRTEGHRRGGKRKETERETY